MRIIKISSINDERLDVFTRLTEHQLRSVLEREKQIMIAESRLVVEVALKKGMEAVAFLLDERHLESLSPLLQGLPDEVPIYIGERSELSQLVGYRVTRGIMAALRRPTPPSPAEILAGTRRVALLEGLVDATNVGALMRSAAALGIDACLLDPSCADPFSRRAARVSMAASYTLPWARFEADMWPHHACALLRNEGFHIIALALKDGATPLSDPALATYDRLALVFGTEAWGISQETLDECDECVVIPMQRGIDSLNVAAASAVAFWQLRARS